MHFAYAAIITLIVLAIIFKLLSIISDLHDKVYFLEQEKEELKKSLFYVLNIWKKTI